MEQPDTTRETAERRRTPPSQRFSASQILIDAGGVAATLRKEDAEFGSRGGHQQMTVFRRGSVTMVVFAFEPGGALPDHTANGLVTIHALRGALTVRTPDSDYELRPDMMVVLAPGIPHSVTASEPSEMLLTVHRHVEPVSGGT